VVRTFHCSCPYAQKIAFWLQQVAEQPSSPAFWSTLGLFTDALERSSSEQKCGLIPGWRFLSIIDHAPTLGDLQQRHYYFARPTLDLRNLGEYDSNGRRPCTVDEQDDDHSSPFDPNTMTLEFRQHASSLDSAEIYAWIDSVLSMVKHAHYTTDADFHNISRNELLKRNSSSINLLLELGCSQDTLLFYSQRLATGQHPRPGNGSEIAAAIAETDVFPH
jgi:hypothetical protein